jgi:hypothetical protein
LLSGESKPSVIGLILLALLPARRGQSTAVSL